MDMVKNPYDGIGKPEQLKGLDNYWSRRINGKHRLIYTVDEDASVIFVVSSFKMQRRIL